MSKADRRAAKKERRRAAREAADVLEGDDVDLSRPPPSPSWDRFSHSELAAVCHTLDRLLALRNIVLADLREHLTPEHRRLLCHPRTRAD